MGGPRAGSGDEAYDLARVGGDVVVVSFEQALDGSHRLVVRALDATSGVPRWTRDLGVSLEPVGTVVPVGNAVAIGGTADGALLVTRLAADGTEVWRTTLRGTATSRFAANAAVGLATDGNGDLLAVGHLSNQLPPRDVPTFVVVKLAGGDGRVLWQTTVGATAADGEGYGRTVAVDPAGDVLVGGSVANAVQGLEPLVAKLSGTHGHVLWERRVVIGRHILVGAIVMVDATGDALMAGEGFAGDRTTFLVTRLSGVDGSRVWTREIATTYRSGTAEALALDGAGHVVAAGTVQNPQTDPFNPIAYDFAVVKLDADTGDTVWLYADSGTSRNSGDWAYDVAVTPTGDVVATGQFSNEDTANDFGVVKLAGGTGDVLWKQTLDGSFSGLLEGDIGYGITSDDSGDVFACGRTKNNGRGVDSTVLRFAGANGDPGPITLVPTCLTDAECVDGDACTVETCRTFGCVSQRGSDFGLCRVSAAVTALAELPPLLKVLRRTDPALKPYVRRVLKLTTASQRALAKLLRIGRFAGLPLFRAETRVKRLQGRVLASPFAGVQRAAILATIRCTRIPNVHNRCSLL